ncbi:MAG: hypothetical protein AAF616_01410 [Bacteroidota bacterium]
MMNRFTFLGAFALLAFHFHATSQTGPGGVSTDLSLWLKANAEVFSDNMGTVANDGENVEEWHDLVGTNDATQVTPGAQPIFRNNDAANINFNPFLQFDGQGDLMDGVGGFHTFRYYVIFAADEEISSSAAGTFIFSWDCAGCGANFGNLAYGDITGALTDEVLTHSTGLWRSGYVGAGIEFDANSVVLFGADEDGTANTELSVNGLSITEVNDGGYEQRLGFSYRIGRRATGTFGGNFFPGKIAEIISYSSQSSGDEDIRIQSYLATKYGITLNPAAPLDYVASDGTTLMWDAASAGVYTNDIAIVGYDVDSELTQLKSQSSNADGVVIIEATGSVGVEITDKEFLSWSNDNDNDGIIETSSSGVPAGVELVLDRTWNVQEEGEVGEVELSFELAKISGIPNASTYFLLLDSDDDFSDASTTRTATPEDGLVTFTLASADINEGDFFTLGLSGFAGPGGVADGLSLWLKADSEVFSDLGATPADDGDAVQQWNDQSIGFDALTSGDDPTFLNNANDNINFNPVLDFNGAGQELVGSGGAFDAAYYLVFQNDLNIDNGGAGASFVLGINPDEPVGTLFGGFALGAVTGEYDDEIFTHAADGSYRSGLTDPMFSLAPNTVLGMSIRQNGSANGNNIFLYGAQINDEQVGTYESISNSNYVVGNGVDAFTANSFNGKIAEIISFSARTTDNQHQRIQSYLAIKYGFTLDPSLNFLAADGSVVWDMTEQAGSYNNDIGVVGRDDVSQLLQTQTKSVNEDAVLTILLDNTGELGDNELLAWGNDGDPLATTTVGAPGSVAEMLDRTWFVQELGETGPMTLSVDLTNLPIPNSASYELLTSTSSNFTSAIAVATSSGASEGIVSFTLDQDDLEDGTFFTIGFSGVTGPGGVVNGLSLWLKADADVFSDDGSTNASSGVAVQQWNDQSLGFDATQMVGADQPIYLNGPEDQLNYNPVLDFAGGGDHLDGSGGAYSNSYYLVFKNDVTIDNSVNARGFVLGMTPNSTSSFDFGGFGIGSITGLLTDEVFMHGANDWRSGYLSTSESITAGSTLLIGVRENEMASETQIFWLGDQVNNGSNGGGAYEVILNQPYTIGDESATGNLVPTSFDGQIAEIISYNTVTTAAEHSQIQSYLGMKYGVTLNPSSPTDYVITNGVTTINVWDATEAATFNNDIAMLGRDDVSELLQPKSKSVNMDAIFAIEASGLDNDQEFLAWSNDNDNDGTFEVVETNLPTGVSQILDRIWYAQELGEVGTLTIEVDLSEVTFTGAESFFLISDSDTDFTSGATLTPTTAVDNDGIVTFTGVGEDVIEDMTYFTVGIGSKVLGPGGVADNLVTWLKADGAVLNDVSASTQALEGETVAQWTNEVISASNAFDATDLDDTDRPTFLANEINFNPALDFDGTDDQLEAVNGAYSTNYYVVIKPDLAVTNFADGRFILGIDNSTFSPGTGTNFAGLITGEYTTGFTGVADEIITHQVNGGDDAWRSAFTGTSEFEANTTFLIAVRDNTVPDGSDLTINGFDITESTTGSLLSLTNEAFRIADQGPNHIPTGIADPLDGKVSEVIFYSARNDDISDERIQSYLAIKYGISLDQTIPQDYFASDGSTVWSPSNPSFVHDIAVVGRDDDSELLQLQSRSSSQDGVVSIELNTTPSNFEFLSWSNNNDDNGSIEVLSEVPAFVESEVVLDRIWQAQEVGNTGPVTIRLDLESLGIPDGTEYFFLTANNESFTSGVSEVSQNSLSATEATFIVPEGFTDGQYFTFGLSGVAAPGGVFDGLSVWLKADAEVIDDVGDEAINGDLVQQWNDSWNANDASQSDADRFPTFLDTDADNINFNPVLDFDGDGQGVGAGNGDNLFGSAGAYSNSYYVVFQSDLTIDDSGDSFVLGMRPNNPPAEFGGLGLGNVTASYAGEVFTHAVDNTYRRGFLSTTQSYDPGTLLAIAVRDNDAGNDIEIFLNGDEISTTSSGTFDQIADTEYFVADEGFGNFSPNTFDGQIAEIVIYDRRTTDEEHQQIQSYLAVKYGFTIDQVAATDYVASDEVALMWDSSIPGATDYDFDIFGIGRDDGSALDQRKSASTNGNDVIGQEDILTIANSSLSVPAPIATDLTFLTIGNDDEPLINAGSSDASGIDDQLLREWKVYTNGHLTLEMQFNLTGLGLSSDIEDFVLLVDRDGDGDFSTGDIDNYLPSALTSDLITFTGVIFESEESTGDVFTLGTSRSFTTGPGGVTNNLNLWLKADQGVTLNATNVSAWADQAGSVDFTQAASGNQPEFSTDFINGNPAIRFNNDGGTNDRLQNTAVTNFPTDELTNFIVIEREEDLNDPIRNEGLFDFWTSAQSNEFEIKDLNESIQVEINDELRSASPDVDFDDRSPHIVGVQWEGTTGGTSFFKDGSSLPLSGTYASGVSLGSTGQLTLGNQSNGTVSPTFAGANAFLGAVAEVILYDQDLSVSSIDQDRVNSYLAIKYGITLDQSAGLQSYIASDFSSVWDATTNLAYNNQIFGIGRDDNAELNQLNSTNEADILTVSSSAIDNTIGYLVVGNNLENPVGSDDDLPLGVDGRLSRVWLAQQTEALNGTLSFDLSGIPGDREAEDLVLLLDDDGTFAGGTGEVFTAGRDLDGNTLSFSIPDFETLPYFTIATVDNTNSTLPVELTSFDAKPEGNGIMVQWETATEINNSHFDLETSYDSEEWSFLARIKGQGNSNELVSYEFFDRSNYQSPLYYRLKQFDFDGAYAYSKIVYVEPENLDFSFSLSPNPVNDLLEIQATSKIERVKVISLSGSIVFQDAPDRFTLEVPTKDFEDGAYVVLLEFSQGARIIKSKIIKN